MSNKPQITKDMIETMFESQFLNVYDIQFAKGRHYYNATRRKFDDATVLKSDAEFQAMVADAVTCIVVIDDGMEERLLLHYEFRYPTGQFLLCPPAGLIDPADLACDNPLFATAIREIREETGLEVQPSDKLAVANPLVFSTPGMTDESNALVVVRMKVDDLSALSQDGAEDSECFDGFLLVNREQAKEILQKGVDPRGNFLPVYTWMALMCFLTDLF